MTNNQSLAITFDKSKAEYDEHGNVQINTYHKSLLRSYLPRLGQVLEQKWGDELKRFLECPPVHKSLKWEIFNPNREVFEKCLEEFVQNVLDGGGLTLYLDGHEGYGISYKAEIEKVLFPLLAPVFERALLEMPTMDALMDMICVATSPDFESEWDGQINDARYLLSSYIEMATRNEEISALFWLKYPSGITEGWFCEPEECLHSAWDVIINELPDELKALHYSVYDKGDEL